MIGILGYRWTLRFLSWSFQVLNRVLYLWQPEAPKKVLRSTFFLRVYLLGRETIWTNRHDEIFGEVATLGKLLIDMQLPVKRVNFLWQSAIFRTSKTPAVVSRCKIYVPQKNSSISLFFINPFSTFFRTRFSSSFMHALTNVLGVAVH